MSFGDDRYFSYEHFYVIYCKFWELDSDHDFLIDKDDLLRYGNHALTYRIVERIFSQVGNCTLPLVLVLGDYVPVIWGLYLCLVRSLLFFLLFPFCFNLRMAVTLLLKLMCIL